LPLRPTNLRNIPSKSSPKQNQLPFFDGSPYYPKVSTRTLIHTEIMRFEIRLAWDKSHTEHLRAVPTVAARRRI